MRIFRKSSAVGFVLLILSICCISYTASAAETWIGTWATGQQLTESQNNPPSPYLANNTLRQIVHATLGGDSLRVHFSNKYSTGAVTINSAHIAVSTSGSAIDTATDMALTFGGASSVTINAGQEIYSDTVDFDVTPLSNLAVSIYFGTASSTSVTGHPGSRTTSYIQAGNAVSAASLPSATTTEHWYILSRIDLWLDDSYGCVVTLGDSITDGRGSTTNGNNRWPDNLAGRLHADPDTVKVGVINQGIGGNCVVSGGLGPTATARFDHDVLGQPGVRWVIILEGVNDIGGNQTAANLIAAYQQFVDKAHANNILAYGVPILPFGGSSYDSTAHRTVRNTVNNWIRTSGEFDAVIDLDAAVRDPADNEKLLAAYDSGDHLHLNVAGYQQMANAIDLDLFIQTTDPPGQASNPSPSNGATNVGTTADLSWTAGSGTASHDVYFGTTSPGTFQGNQTGTTYDTGTMSNSTTYYWRIDEKNAYGTTTGNVWSFTTAASGTPPGQASNPTPSNGATNVGTTADLSWTAGSGATSHDVYFGTTSPGTYQGNQTGTTFDTGTMSNGTTYYWRIDEKNAYGTTTGTIWSFTTTGGGGSSVSLLGTWVTGTSHTRESGTDRALIFIAHGERTGTMNLSAVTYGGQSMTKVVENNTSGGNGYAYAAAFILKETGVAAASGSTFSVTWSGTAPSTSAFSSVFLGNVNQTTATGATGTGGGTTNPATTSALATSSGDMVLLGATCGNAGSYTLNNSFIEGSDQQFGSTATGVTGRKSATGVNETPSATYSSTINRHTIIGLVVKAGSAGPTPPGQATSPSPANGATSVSTTADLSWTAGSGAASHDVYFGTTSPGTFQGNQTGTTFDTGTMSNSTTYYWRIDEKNDYGTTTGTIWSFTTAAAGTPPGQAANPSPANGATSVGTTTDLSWTAGSGAASHDVYFGTTSPGAFQGNQTGTTFDTGTMAAGTTYYWRIDEKNAYGTTTGNVWSFTTASGSNPVSLLGSWVTGTSHTKESGSNRALIFIAHAESTSTISLSSVTYGGQAMTKVVDYSYNAASGYAYAAAFILKESGVAAASGSTFTVTWGGTAPGAAGYSSVFLANVNQTTATGATGTGGRTSNPVTTSSSLATTSGDMVLLAATCGNSGSYTLNNSFTEGSDQQIGGTVTGVTGRKSATGANETPSATYSSTINRQMIIGLVVKRQ